MNFPNPELVVLAGSHGYGTNVETSDEDFRGFFMPSTRALLGFLGEVDSYVSPEGSKSDVALWEVRKFFKMCTQANPNVIETLFLPEKNIIRATPLARKVLSIRDRFLSRRLARTYMGYASGNFKRITGQAVRSAMGQEGEKYDTKDAMHFVRLVRTGQEVLETGVLRVQRPEDREEFLAIRRGDRALGWIMDQMFEAQENWKRYEAASPLPESPDENALNDVLVEMMEAYMADT